MLKAEKSRLRTVHVDMRGSLQRMIEVLKEEIKRLEGELDRFMKEHEDWKEQEQILCSAKGVGRVMAATLLAELPELGKLDRKKIAHVDLGGDEIQPVDQGAVSRIVETGEGQESSLDSLYAEVPNHLECDDARQGSIQADGHRLRGTGFPF